MVADALPMYVTCPKTETMGTATATMPGSTWSSTKKRMRRLDLGGGSGIISMAASGDAAVSGDAAGPAFMTACRAPVRVDAQNCTGTRQDDVRRTTSGLPSQPNKAAYLLPRAQEEKIVCTGAGTINTQDRISHMRPHRTRLALTLLAVAPREAAGSISSVVVAREGGYASGHPRRGYTCVTFEVCPL